MTILKKTLTALLLFLAIINNLSAESSDKTSTDEVEVLKQYDIEVIIFEDAYARYINSESWHKNIPEEENLPNDEVDTVVKSEPLTAETYTLDESATFESITPEILSIEYKKIKSSSQFNVLFYSAWRQTGLDKTKAFEINIDELKNAHQNTTKNSLTGNLKVVLARYLHVYSQLEYRRGNVSDDKNDSAKDNSVINSLNNLFTDEDKSNATKPENGTYSMQSHRRMRSKELHYIDHPLVGILIQINPVEISP